MLVYSYRELNEKILSTFFLFFLNSDTARKEQVPKVNHLAELRVGEELNNLRSHMASSSAPSPEICDRLRGLGHLYSLVKELFPLDKQPKDPTQKKRVEEELEGFIKLLDLCNAVKDCLTLMKEQVKGVEFALRRRDTGAIASRVNVFVHFGRKANKNIK